MTARKYVFSLVAASILLGVSAERAFAEQIVFDTAALRYVISEDGMSKSLVDKKSGQELLVGPATPFAAVRKGGRFFPATGIRKTDGLFRVDFGQTGISADYRISSYPNYLVIELAQVTGSGIEEIRLSQLRVGALSNVGIVLTALWNEKLVISLMALSDKVDSRFGDGLLLSSVYPDFGMVGEKVAIVVAPTGQFTDIVQQIESKFRIPSPKIGGTWAKKSPDVRSSYLYTDLTEANVDEAIRYAKRGGLKYILIYSTSWSSSLGSYPINMLNYPHGEEGLKSVIDKCHAAGIKVGMHMLTSFVDKGDAFVKKQPEHLISNAEAVLANDIDEKSAEIVTRKAWTVLPEKGFSSQYKEVRIDDEIIHYDSNTGTGPSRFMQCTRGYAGTKPAPHKAGSTVHHLAEYAGSYLADLRTPLQDEIAERVAGLINRCGFDMIYFDGGELSGFNGPYWYWSGQQQLNIWKRVKRDLLVQGSGMTHWTWHIVARGVSDDSAAVAPKQYLDYHKIPDYWQVHVNSFMPAELGWWNILSSAPDYPSTLPDEVEFYAVRMLALNSPVSLETSLSWLKANGRTDEMLGLLGEYEQIRLNDAVPPSIRAKLKTGEWHMAKKGGRPEFMPVKYDTQRIDMPGDIHVKNEFGPQKFKFRLQAIPHLTNGGDRSNIPLVRADSPVVLSQIGNRGMTPGTLAGRVALTRASRDQFGMFLPAQGAQSGQIMNDRSFDLATHRALLVKLNVDAPLPKQGEQRAVLNVQLESGAMGYRDYYIDLDFVGEKTVIIPEPNTERMLPEFRPSYMIYDFKSAMRGFNYKDIQAVNFRWMRQPTSVPLKCTITLVEALTETESVLKNPEISMGPEKIVIPVTLKSGDYLEFWGEGPARVFDRNGRQLATVTMLEFPKLLTGDNRIKLLSDDKVSAKLTTILLGEALTF